jgi:adenine phosphoribosyltransferase
MKRGVDLDAFVVPVRDFPSPGVVFQDLSPLMRNADALRAAGERLAEPFGTLRPSVVAGIDARGFVFGAVVATLLGVGFVPLRKAGKLPRAVDSVSYALEYGTGTLAIHQDALDRNDRVVLVDDVLATGGTAAAGLELVRGRGATVVGCAFVLEIVALHGRAVLGDIPVRSLMLR